MHWLNVAAWLPCTEVEGPGKRAAIWVQGCDQRCVGCCNPEFLKLVERNMVPAEVIADRILQAQIDFDIEGVTFLGGEPFLQAKGLGQVARRLSKAGLTVMTFTGYRFEEIGSLALPGSDVLLMHTDVLVDGPYEAGKPDSFRNWVGSTNQRFIYLTDRYDLTIEQAHQATREVEVRISADGRVSANGWPCLAR